ncbi:MAG: hypothetical protein V1746_04515 [bacterium]
MSVTWIGCVTDETIDERKKREGISGPGVILDETEKNRSDKGGEGAQAEAFRYRKSF